LETTELEEKASDVLCPGLATNAEASDAKKPRRATSDEASENFMFTYDPKKQKGRRGYM
jgi:hypothetical protein